MLDNPLSVFAANPSSADWGFAAMWLLGGAAVAMALRALLRTLAKPLRLQDYASKLITRLVSTGVMIAAGIYALGQLDVEVGPLIGALGVTGIVIALALQPVMGNLVAAIMLHARRPIRPGDQIGSNEYRGTVLEINSRAVVVLSYDGETVYLPNLSVLDHPLVNQTREEYRRTVLPFQVGYEADLRQTQRVLVEAIRAVDALADPPLPADVLVTGFAESGVNLVARFWHPSEELSAWHAVSEVAITIRETLRREQITIPFPQRVLHLAESASNETLRETFGQQPARPPG
jgi:small-conductance mechanosensitive channel